MFHRFALSMILLCSTLMTTYGQEKIEFEHKVNGQHYCLVLISGGNQLVASQCSFSDSDTTKWTMDGLIRNEGYSSKCLTGSGVADRSFSDSSQYFVPVPVNGHYYLYHTVTGNCITLDPDNIVGNSLTIKYELCDNGDDEKHQRIKLKKYPNSFWALA